MSTISIKHQLPTLGELRLVFQSFIVAVIVSSAVGTFAALQNLDSWVVRLVIYSTAAVALIPLFMMPYWRHLRERSERHSGYKVETLAIKARQRDEELSLKLLLSGALEADLRSDLKEVQLILTDVQNMKRRASNIDKSAERAQLLIQLSDLQHRGERLLDRIEEQLRELRAMRQSEAKRIDAATANAFEREQLLQQASVVRSTRNAVEDFIVAFRKTKEYAHQ